MKRFLKSFGTSLLIGIPIVTVLIFALFCYTNFVQPPVPLNTESLSPEEEVSSAELGEETSQDLPDISTDLPADSSQESSSASTNLPETNVSETQTGSATLSFAGDVYFSELVMENYDKNGIHALVDDEMLSFMQDSDFLIFNNEFAFSTRGEAMADKEYTLRCDPKYVKILQDLGSDAVSIANNHILDFGRNAFLDTLDTLETAQIAAVGGGRNLEEACAPAVTTIQGQTFAIFAATRVSPSYDWYAGKEHPGIMQTYDAEPLNRGIKEAESLYDHTIVFVHWGIERSETPEEYQRTLAKGYIDAGADLVIGCHPHVLQGFEYYNGVPIIYSLGNYLFGNRTGETLLLNATFDEQGSLSIQLIPCQRVNGVLTKISEPADLFHHLTDLSIGVSISQGGLLVSSVFPN